MSYDPSYETIYFCTFCDAPCDLGRVCSLCKWSGLSSPHPHSFKGPPMKINEFEKKTNEFEKNFVHKISIVPSTDPNHWSLDWASEHLSSPSVPCIFCGKIGTIDQSCLCSHCSGPTNQSQSMPEPFMLNLKKLLHQHVPTLDEKFLDETKIEGFSLAAWGEGCQQVLKDGRAHNLNPEDVHLLLAAFVALLDMSKAAIVHMQQEEEAQKTAQNIISSIT